MEKSRLYTLSVDGVYEILNDAQDDCDISRDFLSTYLDMAMANEYICFLLSDTAVLTEDKQFLIAEDSLNILQSLVLSKHAALRELCMLSVSLQKN